MGTLCEEVNSGKVLVSDGAWGTFLADAGLQAGECPELWNVEHPDVVRNIARSYAEAGADMVLTNSFGGTRFKLEPYGLANRVAELNKRCQAGDNLACREGLAAASEALDLWVDAVHGTDSKGGD